MSDVIIGSRYTGGRGVASEISLQRINVTDPYFPMLLQGADYIISLAKLVMNYIRPCKFRG